MFAKVFEQIFDSSIAEDYNCRRMFMDLLVLADSDGAVDMTIEAISRRTNVPVDEVVKYVKELCQPDAKSRSKLEEGKRLVPLDCNRDWGWRIVNYVHYRKIRDEAARREYFRDKQREHRKKAKQSVKDMVLTEGNKNGHLLTPASASSCTYVLKEGVRGRFEEWMQVRKAMGKAPKNWGKMFDEQIQWLTQFNEADQKEILSASIRNNWQGLFPPKTQNRNGDGFSPEHRQNRINFLNDKKAKVNRTIKDPQNPPSWAVKELAQIDKELKTL